MKSGGIRLAGGHLSRRGSLSGEAGRVQARRRGCDGDRPREGGVSVGQCDRRNAAGRTFRDKPVHLIWRYEKERRLKYTAIRVFERDRDPSESRGQRQLGLLWRHGQIGDIAGGDRFRRHQVCAVGRIRRRRCPGGVRHDLGDRRIGRAVRVQQQGRSRLQM